MFDYIQLFIISNGTETKYYSNTTRYAREQEADKQKGKEKKIQSNSFEVYHYWSDRENNPILPTWRTLPKPSSLNARCSKFLPNIVCSM